MVIEEENTRHLLILKFGIIELIKPVGVGGLENSKQFELRGFDPARNDECGIS